MQPTSEQHLQSTILDYCAMRKVAVIRINSIRRGYMRSYYWNDLHGKKRSSGVSDLIVFSGGKAAFLEMKRDGKAKSNSTTEEAQAAFREWCAAYGITIYRVDSLDVGLKIIDGIAKASA